MSMIGRTLKTAAMNRIFALLAPALLLSVASAAAQPEAGLPERAMQRFGTTKLRPGSRIFCLAYSHDGANLAAGGYHDPVRLWNPKTGEVIREFAEPGVLALA